MAKILIVIEDQPDGTVSCVSTPNFAEMMRDGEGPLTAAEGYALFALNQIRNESKQRGNILLKLPKIGKPGGLFKKWFGLGMLLLLAPLPAAAAPTWTGIVVHHTADNQDMTAKRIGEIHKRERGFDEIGYHYVIRADGSVEEGRSLGKPGAHALTGAARSRNRSHIGIALTGTDHFTPAQEKSLQALVAKLRDRYKIRSVENHHEQCPGRGISKTLWSALNYEGNPIQSRGSKKVRN